MWRVLHQNRYKAYKIHVSQTLHPGDNVRRLNFCNWLVQQTANDATFLNKIIWSDECRFTNVGMFNRKNEHYWSVHNPRRFRAVRNQTRFHLNVWAGILGDRILGPFFYGETLNGERYLNFLRTQFLEYLEDIPLLQLGQLWMQQDGAPPHNSIPVRNFLNQHFQNQWIGNRGVVEWPARSPDLSPLDFFLWGNLKNKIYKNNIDNRDELRRGIINAFATIRARDIQRAINNTRKRANLCIIENGLQFEHLL